MPFLMYGAITCNGLRLSRCGFMGTTGSMRRSLTLAPGAVEAASEHALLLLPRLRLLRQQRAEIARRIEALLGELAVAWSLKAGAPITFSPAKATMLRWESSSVFLRRSE